MKLRRLARIEQHGKEETKLAATEPTFIDLNPNRKAE
jgi:hypothetical protein